MTTNDDTKKPRTSAIDTIVENTSSVWFIPALILLLTMALAGIAAVETAGPHPRTIVGHQQASIAYYRDKNGKEQTSYLTDSYSTNEDGVDLTWITVVTKNGSVVGCELNSDEANNVSPRHDQVIRCRDTSDERVVTMSEEISRK